MSRFLWQKQIQRSLGIQQPPAPPTVIESKEEKRPVEIKQRRLPSPPVLINNSKKTDPPVKRVHIPIIDRQEIEIPVFITDEIQPE